MFTRNKIVYSGFSDYSIIKKLVYVAIILVIIAAIWAGYFFVKYISSSNNINLKGYISYKSKPLSGVNISDNTISTVSDESGSFILPHLKFGSNTVTFEKDGYATQQEKIFLWHKNQQIKEVVMVRDSNYSLNYSGIVSDNFDKTPIKGAIIKLGDANATTDDTGKFSFTDLPNGATNFSISAVGYWDINNNNFALNDSTSNNQEYDLTPYGKISFMSLRDGKKNIYSINYDGKNLQNLTADIKGDCWGGQFTPDGSALVFYSNFENNLDKWGQPIPAIYILAKGSSKPTKLSQDIIPDTGFRISADGSTLVFSGSARDSDKSEIYVVGIGKNNSDEWVQLTDNDIIESNIDISPDGNWITYGAFTSDGERDIFIQKVGDFDNKKISTSQDRESSILYSPDGKNILYVRESLDSGSSIYLYNIASDSEKEIYKTTSDIGNVSWDKPSDKIVFTSTRDGQDGIYTIDADGSNEVKLTSQGADYENILWPPLNKILVFMIKKSTGNSLSVMDISRRSITEIEQASDDVLSWNGEVFDTSGSGGL